MNQPYKAPRVKGTHQTLSVELMKEAQIFKHLLAGRARLALLVLAAVIPFALFIAYQIVEIRDRRVNEALQRVTEYAQLAADSYEDDIIEAKSLIELAARIPAVIDGTADSCQEFLNSAALSRRWAHGIWVVNHNGLVRCSTIANAAGLDLSGREEYRRAAAANGFQVSDFFIGKLRQQPLALASAPAVSQSGERVLIGITLALSWFDRLAATVGERAGAMVLLMDSKGTVLSNYPNDKAMIGRSVAHHKAAQTMLAASHGHFEGILLNGKPGFLGFKKLAGTNLRLAVGFDRDALLANVNRGTTHAIIIFVLVTAIMSFLIWSAGNKFFASPMRELDELLKATLENMDQGLIVVDRDGTLPICNKRAIELLDLPDDLMSSRPVAEAVIAYQTAQGEFDNVNDEIRGRLLPRVNGESRNIYERERPNGTVLEIRTVPFAGGAGVVRTYTDVTARKTMERLLEELAQTDDLTKLSNRRHFDAALEKEVSRARRCKGKLALVMADVDYFKAFNDRYGHLAGDSCLQSIAKAVQASIRRPGDVAARYGGEELIIMLPGADLAGGLAVAEQVRRTIIALGIEHEGSSHGTVTVSIGVAATADEEMPTAREIIAQADAALYRAKHNGRNRVETFAAREEHLVVAA